MKESKIERKIRGRLNFRALKIQLDRVKRLRFNAKIKGEKNGT